LIQRVMTKRRLATVGDDPTKSAPIGTELRINHVHFSPHGASGTGEVENWDFFGSALLAVQFGTPEVSRVDGSAVLIGPGLALAARHVFDPVIDDLRASRLGALAFSIMPDGLMFWRLRQVFYNDTDVVLLRLELASPVPTDGLTCATLTTRTPAIGEPVMIAGARGEEVGTARDSPARLSVRVGVGEVGEVHSSGRDRMLMPDPCLRVDCLTVGGMRGGPAFDKDGNVLGILSRSWSTNDDLGPSYVAFWWPVAAQMIETIWPAGLISLPTSLLELADNGVVPIVGREAMKEITSPDGAAHGQIQVDLAPWT